MMTPAVMAETRETRVGGEEDEVSCVFFACLYVVPSVSLRTLSNNAMPSLD